MYKFVILKGLKYDHNDSLLQNGIIQASPKIGCAVKKLRIGIESLRNCNASFNKTSLVIYDLYSLLFKWNYSDDILEKLQYPHNRIFLHNYVL